MRSVAVDDYLKAIYEIEREEGKVATSALAARVGITPGSATGMIKRLADMNLVAHEPYRGVVLTEVGQRVALRVVRQHRLVERFLADALAVPWDRVHEEAHRIEHVLSEYLEERMDSVLGRPTTDPHGSPIPTRNGAVSDSVCVPLADMKPENTVVIVEVSDHDPALLRYMGELGLFPETEVAIVAKAPFGGPLTVRVGGDQRTVSREVARHVFVVETTTQG